MASLTADMVLFGSYGVAGRSCQYFFDQRGGDVLAGLDLTDAVREDEFDFAGNNLFVELHRDKKPRARRRPEI